MISKEESFIDSNSQYYRIGNTKYGGRGCFAIEEIENDTIIHISESPLSSTISKPFKKEVCQLCFKYEFGKYMKFKVSQKVNKDQHCSIWFCSQECEDNFKKHDVNDIYINNLLNCEKYYLLGLSKPEIEAKEPKGDLNETINEEWAKVDLWNEKIANMKPSKLLNLIPRIDDSEYLEIKYVIGVLFQIFEGETSENRELSLFKELQSSEIEKYHRYPYLLYSYINIYKFVKLTCSKELQKYITPDSIRSIIGKNLSNAFGIWSESNSKDEDKEFLGFGVYPSASFFNHSCDPNLIKIRIKEKLTKRIARMVFQMSM
ncbi:unnamed protein product [Candida verbasci]|uniref:SET domain-containing protein n=1 Tax=Candida verbasci TaxID=1227364 RepID=A0A9W4TZX2_9ASCO|nr:unnamed protein product [Candida verbasci]